MTASQLIALLHAGCVYAMADCVLMCNKWWLLCMPQSGWLPSRYDFHKLKSQSWKKQHKSTNENQREVIPELLLQQQQQLQKWKWNCGKQQVSRSQVKNSQWRRNNCWLTNNHSIKRAAKRQRGSRAQQKNCESWKERSYNIHPGTAAEVTRLCCKNGANEIPQSAAGVTGATEPQHRRDRSCKWMQWENCDLMKPKEKTLKYGA